MDVVERHAGTIWALYQAELAAGTTALAWAAWLDAAKAHRPRLAPMVRFVRFALADARMWAPRAPEPAVGNRWAL